MADYRSIDSSIPRGWQTLAKSRTFTLDHAVGQLGA